MEKSNHTILSVQFTRLFASGVIVIGLLVLIGWFSKLMFLTRFSINEVPMAPSTAYVFIFMAAGFWFYLRPQKTAINRNLAIASAAIAIGLSCLIVITNLLQHYGNWEHVFITIPETQLSMQLGHMSLVTAVLFIISGFALLFLLSNRKILKTFSIILTLIIFTISFILLLGYAFGAPFFYFDTFIPPAVLTVLSFLLVSLALTAASDRNTFIIKSIWKESTSARLLRIFLPTTIAITVVEGILVIRILPLFNIHPAIVVTLVSLIIVAVLIVVIPILSKSMGKALDSALENLSESEAKFKTLVKNNEEIIYMIDKNGIFQLSEGKGLLNLGMKPGQVVGESVFEIYKDYPEMLIDMKKTLKGETMTVEHKVGDMYFSNWYTPHKNSSGEIIGLLGLSVDITGRKQAEEELTESNEKYLNLMDSLGTGVVLHGPDTSIILSNPKASEILGISLEQMKGKKAIDPEWRFVRKDGTDLPLEEYPVNKALRLMQSFSEYFIGLKRSDRKYITWVNVNASLVYDEYKKIKYVTISFNDTTEQKQAELELKENEEKFRTLVANVPGVTYRCDYEKDWTMRFLSDQIKDLSGYPAADFISSQIRSYSSIIHADDRTEVENSVFSAVEKKESYQIEYRINHANGEIRWIYENGQVIFDENDDVSCLDGVLIDITERKLAEEEVKKSQILLQQAEEISNQGAWEWDIVKDEWTFSENWLRVHGCSLSGITREELMTISYPEDVPEVEKAFQDALKGGAPYNIEHRIVRQNDGEIRYVHAKGNLILNDSGKALKMFGVAQDITDDKLAKEALHESEAKLSALFTSMTEIVVMHELVVNPAGKAVDYRIIDCNNAYTEATGVSKEDALGKLASEVYQTTPPPFLEQYAKVAQGGVPHEFTTYYSPLEKHYMISVVSLQAGKFSTITTDISDMMQIQETIIAKNKEMENYLYVASHDLRTPLVNIQGFSQRLKKQADSIKGLFADKTLEPEILHQLGIITDEDIPKTLRFILSNIEKMDLLINGLLQLSRTGRVEMSIQKVDMNALFLKILQSLDFQIKEAECKIHIDPLPACYGDAALLDQLFANIISNALKYSDSERALEITVDAKKTYNRVVYTIRDNGKGIAQKYLNKIWDVFYRIDPRSGKTGEGIGLSLVKRIAEKHKGKVWVESEENKGCDFYIELPTRSFTEL